MMTNISNSSVKLTSLKNIHVDTAVYGDKLEIATCRQLYIINVNSHDSHFPDYSGMNMMPNLVAHSFSSSNM